MRTEYNFIEAKKRWHEICESKEYYMPIYHKDWYWNAVCDNPNEWCVIVYEDKDVIAAFPFGYKKVHGMWRIENVWQVARAGIWTFYKKEVSVEKKSKLNCKIVEYVLARLPIYDYFNVVFLPQYTDCQALYWNGFTVEVTYNHYIIDRSIDDVKAKCSKKRRQRINTSSSVYEMKIDDITIDEYWNFFESVYKCKQAEISFPKCKFDKFLKELLKQKCIQMRSASLEGKLVAVAIYLEDERCIYHQFCANTQGNNDAQTLLTYNTIVDAMAKGKKFDFEGSMIKGVAEYNLSYSPEVEVCYVIHKESKKYFLMKTLKRLLG